jgi:hypothetical protein
MGVTQRIQARFLLRTAILVTIYPYRASDQSD